MPEQPDTANARINFVRTSSGGQAALYIRRSIFDGVLRPGERVPQDQIASTLGISRIPIREALIALEREGWVTIEMHRGAFINPFDRNWVTDNYELFGLLYGLAARRALDRGAAFITGLVPVQAAFSKAKTAPELSREASKFNALIVEASNSSRIKIALRTMSALVPGEFFELVPGAAAVQRRGFQAILRALRRGDGDAASAAYLRMMREVAGQVSEVFRERGLFGAASVAGGEAQA
jgi:DNA-binding GntR family transcriptional regulator